MRSSLMRASAAISCYRGIGSCAAALNGVASIWLRLVAPRRPERSFKASIHRKATVVFDLSVRLLHAGLTFEMRQTSYDSARCAPSARTRSASWIAWSNCLARCGRRCKGQNRRPAACRRTRFRCRRCRRIGRLLAASESVRKALSAARRERTPDWTATPKRPGNFANPA
jgi:hypothetical protein